MKRSVLGLLAATLVPACSDRERESFQERYDLYAVRPDPVSEGRVRLGQSEEEVARKMGNPSIGFEQVRGGHRWTEWTYSDSQVAWEPESGDDTGFFKADRFPKKYTQDTLRLTFRDGRLRLIEDPVHQRFDTDLVGRAEWKEYEAIRGEEEAGD